MKKNLSIPSLQKIPCWTYDTMLSTLQERHIDKLTFTAGMMRLLRERWYDDGGSMDELTGLKPIRAPTLPDIESVRDITVDEYNHIKRHPMNDTEKFEFMKFKLLNYAKPDNII